MIISILSLISGYLLGSIPSALIMSRLRKGIDIRKVGSVNMGAANIVREIGIWEGLTVGIADIGKGALAVIIPILLGIDEPWIMAAGFCVILGHKYPVFAHFNGGKGSATIIGIFLVLSPLAIVLSLIIIAIPLFTNRNFAFAITVGFTLLPLFIWLLDGRLLTVLYSVIIDLFMAISNMGYLIESWKKISRR